MTNGKAQMGESGNPAFRVYSAIPRQGNGEDWLSIGLAVPHRDGQGFDVLLQALPLNPKLVLRGYAGGDLQVNDPVNSGRPRDAGRLLSLKQQVDAFERVLIELCLLESCGKISAVMERLDIPRRTLSEKMARLGIDRRRLVNGANTSASAKRSLDAGRSD